MFCNPKTTCVLEFDFDNSYRTVLPDVAMKNSVTVIFDRSKN